MKEPSIFSAYEREAREKAAAAAAENAQTGATALRATYLALRETGFSRNQAFQLTLELLRKVM